MSRAPQLREKVVFLKRPSSYGRQVRAVRAMETHFAWVFLAGEDAWKLKKPLRHKQMDYRSLAARKRGCLEEVRLNRPLAAGIYKGAVPLTMAGGALCVGGKGEIVDWLIRMRRLPEAAMLDHALVLGHVTERHMDRVALTLLRFYEGAAPHRMTAARYVERFAKQVRANAREISGRTDHLLRLLTAEVSVAQLVALKRLKPQLAARAAHVVEGHGDLRAEHVYLGRPIAVIDALEFDERLRWLDPAEEVSLLALEIERAGRLTLADRLVGLFRRGLASAPSPELFSLYKSHRAATRAKLAAWHIGDPQFPDAAPWVARTESLLQDALRYAELAAGRAPSDASRRSADDRPTALLQRRKRRARTNTSNGFGDECGHMQFR